MEELLGMSVGDDDMAMFEALYADASPDGPDHFPVVWDKVKAMWLEPFDWSDDLARIRCPVLVTLGDDDMITIDHGAELASRVPDGQLAVLPGTSHLAPMEKPDLYNRLVLDFVTNPAVETFLPQRRRPAG